MAGKVYFVTGSNRGIGFEIVKQLAEDASNTVIGSTRDESRSSDLISLSKKLTNLKIVKLDVGEQSSIDKLSSQLLEVAPDGIDIFISNAGLYGHDSFQRVFDTERSIWFKHFETNTVGPVFTIKAIFPFLEKKPTKQIILISSIAGQITDKSNFENTAYGVSKVALNFIGLSLSDELDGYTVVAIHPGVVSTETEKSVIGGIVKRRPELKPVYDNLPVITAEESAKGIIKIVSNVDESSNRTFYNYNGAPLKW